MDHSNIDVNFQTLFESAPALCLVLLPDLTIVAVSDAYLRATMTEREIILGKGLFEIFPDNPNDPNATGVQNLKASLNRVLNNRSADTMAIQKYDIRKPEAEGGAFEERFWSPLNMPILDDDGNITYIIHRVEDVTEFVRLKSQDLEKTRVTDELRRRAGEMEGEIFLRAQELQQQKHQLEALNQALQTARDQAIESSNLKSAFVATISHELRTPLSGLIGFLELALKTELNADQRVLITTANESAEALLTILNDILDLSRIEAGKATLEYVPFNGIFLVQDVSRLLAETARKKGLLLSTYVDQRIPQFVIGDPSRMRQVLLNLITNAIKFTDSGEIAVRAVIESQDRHHITIKFSVTDTGVGISEDDRRLLFLPFSQVDSSNTRKHGGTGLGLAISKRFVEMMGGQMGVTSERGKGSTFYFEIPFQREEDATTSAPHADTSREIGEGCCFPQEKLVLVVEDSPVIQMLAMKQLVTLGVQCQSASNGRAAIETVRHVDFDLILMDCQMPEMDGFKATSAIRQLESARGRHTPIIAMTAGAMVGDREKCLKAGMDDYLSKPFNIQQLKEKIQQWLQFNERPSEIKTKESTD